MEIGTTTDRATETASESPNVLEQTGLGRDAFLKLFIAQLQNQDPLNPQDPTELSSQLAQFSQFEQALRMVAELEGINRRLDDLLEATEAREAQSVDPLTLLGREVEFRGDHVAVSSAGTAPPLRFELSETAQALGFAVRDADGDSIGQALLPPAGTDRSIAIAAGSYALQITDGRARLVGPSGQAENVEFVRIRRTADGSTEVERDADGNPLVLSFDPDRTYSFALGATTLTGQPLELSTTTTGTVEAVRNTPGNPTVVVNGQELELSQIIRIN